MKENGWESGRRWELFELAMHDRQYRDYKSGVAKKRFEEELQRAKDAALASKGSQKRFVSLNALRLNLLQLSKKARNLGNWCWISFFSSICRKGIQSKKHSVISLPHGVRMIKCWLTSKDVLLRFALNKAVLWIRVMLVYIERTDLAS